CGFGDARVHGPRAGENVRVLERGLITNGIAFAGDAFDYMQRGAVKPAIDAQPGVVVEVRGVNNQSIALPMSDGVSVVAGVGLGVMRAAVGGNQAKRVS